MKKVFSVMSLVLSLFATTAMADGIYVGYCDGEIGTTEFGITGTNASIHAAMRLTPEMLGAYTQSSITAIHAGMANKATAFPEELKVWIRESLSGEDLATGTMSNPQKGWNTIALDAPLALTNIPDSGLWIGYSFTQEKKLSVIAFGKNTENLPDVGWLSKKTTWYDYSQKGGIVPLEVLIEGEGLPQNNLTLKSATASPSLVRVGDEVKFNVTIKNSASNTAVNPIISYDIADGQVSGSYETNITLKQGEKKTLSFKVSCEAITEEMDANAVLTLKWADDVADDYEADNSANVTIHFVKNFFPKMMLVEEGTGAWCGWCVRGIVGLREMREKFPDSFIGIGVHNQDSYQVNSYNSWMTSQISGFPSCLINRDGKVYDPNYEELENYMHRMETSAEAGIKVSGYVEEGQLVVQSCINFVSNRENETFKVVYVVVEDSLQINQQNYYAGGSYGVMGGFENLPSTANVYIDDVARGVFPSPQGAAVELPAQILKGNNYWHSLITDMPTVENMDKTFLVAILLDAKGKVVNACKGEFGDATGISMVKKSNTTGSEEIFNLQGQRINAAQKGINIVNGKMIIK